MKYQLPDIKKAPIIPEYFPTPMQTFIFRNWETVSKTRLAEVLGTTVENIEAEAKRMGLKPQGDTGIWSQKGYITIIRANWHLLPYNQLLQLLGWDEEKLARVLKDDDFLDIKLGSYKPLETFKPDAKEIKYRPLTANEIKATEKIKTEMKSLFSLEGDKIKAPFDFWSEDKTSIALNPAKPGQVTLDDGWVVCDSTKSPEVSDMSERFISSMKKSWNVALSGTGKNIILLEFAEGKTGEYHEIIVSDSSIIIRGGSSEGILRGIYRLEDLAKLNSGPHFDKGKFVREPRFKARIIYSFCGLYEMALDVDSRTYCPDSLLEKYARVGVNGIYLPGVLYRMSEFPYAPELSEGWQKRLENLKAFTERAAKYSIKIYLYLNEPRTMPLSVFKNHPDMRGALELGGKNACMCLTSEKSRNFIYNSVLTICRNAPKLGGIFTITMSENLTNCKAREVAEPCEKCRDIPTWDLISTVNSLIAKAAHSVNPDMNIIAWDTAWDPNREASEAAKSCIVRLPEDVAIMCQREECVPFEIGGIKNKVIDYSLSVEGLSEKSKQMWKWAKELGHETAVKMQINNTWECSTTPYLPVYRILFNIMKEVLDAGIDHLLLSWTLGGYPSPSIRLMSEAFFAENGKKAFDIDSALKIVYGDKADNVKKATDIFSDAFKEFPFDIDVAYLGPQNAGPANIFYHKPTGYNASMTCFSYDALDDWRVMYPRETFLSQFKIMSEKWREGLALLEKGTELYDISYVSYSLLRSSYNITEFIMLRDKYLESGDEKIKPEIVKLLEEEKEIASKVYEIMTRRPEVGYEAANHYYFSQASLMEKVINCAWLTEYYS